MSTKLYVDDIKDDEQMFLYTGMSKQSFYNLLNTVKPHEQKCRYWQGPLRTVNNVKRTLKKTKKRYLSVKNELFLSLLKIKTGLHVRIIGDLFNLSTSSVSRICLTWWKYLRWILGTLVYNPEKDVVFAQRQKAFNDPLYRDTRHIIDATEFFLLIHQSPSQ